MFDITMASDVSTIISIITTDYFPFFSTLPKNNPLSYKCINMIMTGEKWEFSREKYAVIMIMIPR